MGTGCRNRQGLDVRFQFTGCIIYPAALPFSSSRPFPSVFRRSFSSRCGPSPAGGPRRPRFPAPAVPSAGFTNFPHFFIDPLEKNEADIILNTESHFIFKTKWSILCRKNVIRRRRRPARSKCSNSWLRIRAPGGRRSWPGGWRSPPNLAFRVLNVLQEKGYVKRNPAGQYELTAGFIRSA